MKVTLTDETWISKSALNQKQKKKKELPFGKVLLLVSTACLSLAYASKGMCGPWG